MTTFTDDFNRADGSVGASWTQVSGTWTIASNRLSPGTTGTGLVLTAVTAMATNDNSAQATIAVTAAASQGVWCRGNSGITQGYLWRNDGTTWTLFSVLGGSFTSIGTFAAAAVSGDVAKVQAVGSTIKGFVNGVQQVSVTNTVVTTGTSVGIRSDGASALRYDDFTGADVTSGTTAVAGQAAGSGTAYAPRAGAAAVAGQAAGTGTAYAPGAALVGTAGTASGSGTAYAPGTGTAPSPATAAGSGTAYAPRAGAAPSPATAAGTGTAYAPGAALAGTVGQAAGTGTVFAPVGALAGTAGRASGTGTAYAPATAAVVIAVAGHASGAGTAYTPGTAIVVTAAAGHASGSAHAVSVQAPVSAYQETVSGREPSTDASGRGPSASISGRLPGTAASGREPFAPA